MVKVRKTTAHHLFFMRHILMQPRPPNPVGDGKPGTCTCTYMLCTPFHGQGTPSSLLLCYMWAPMLMLVRKRVYTVLVFVFDWESAPVDGRKCVVGRRGGTGHAWGGTMPVSQNVIGLLGKRDAARSRYRVY